MSRVVAIFGPTASGKTDVAEAIADRIPAALVSADAMQAYRGLPILTNQSEPPDGARRRLAALARRLARGVPGARAPGRGPGARARRTPVVVGGTGLYLRAAVSDLELPPPPAPGVRERWDARYEELGPEGAHAELAAVDAAAAAAVHPNDRRRVVRALELAEAGASLSPDRDRLWSEETRHPTLIVGLDVPREELDRRIAGRTQRMLERGVVDEVRTRGRG